MPFTFGLHPSFIVNDFNSLVLSFKDDKEVILVNSKTRELSKVSLGEYKNFLNDLSKYDTVVFKDLKSKYVTMKTNDYDVKVDLSNFRHLALWSPNPKSKFMCIEPWMSFNDIKTSNNPFKEDFELIHLKSNESFKTSYYIEIN